MKQVLQQFFRIRDGELRITLLMQFFIFLLINALLILKTVVNAVFLDELPVENLSQAYILVAICALISSYFYNRILNKIRLKWMIVVTLSLFSIAFFVFGSIIRTSYFSHFFLFAFYVFVALYAVITTSQFWLLSNYIYNAREAKRLFSFIGAGAISGGILGGYLVGWLVDAIGITGVIWAGSFMIAFCIPILLLITSLRKKRLQQLSKTSRSSSQSTTIAKIFKSNHVIYLALVVAFSVIVARLVDYQFSSFAQAMIPEATELSRFFGFWFSTFNVIALLFQLFLTHTFLKLLGVTKNLLLLPIGLITAMLTFIFIPELWVVILLKGLDGSFKQSINKAALELAVIPMPHHLKSHAKTFIDVVVDSVATGIAGVLLFILIQQFGINDLAIKLLTVVLIICWIFCVIKLRTEYFKSFAKILKKSISVEQGQLTKKFQNLSEEQMKIILATQDEDQILNLLPYVTKNRLLNNIQLFLDLLGHANLKLNLEIIKILPYTRTNEIRLALQHLLLNRQGPLIDAVLNYLIDDPYVSDTSFFNKFLNHPKRKIARSALRCLAIASIDNEKLAVKFKLNSLLDKQINEIFIRPHRPKIGNLLMTIAHSKRLKYYYLIEQELKSTTSRSIKKAIKAAGTTTDPYFIPLLIKLLDRRDLTESVQKALSKYGNELISTLNKRKRISKLTAHRLMLLARPISLIGSRKSRELLRKWLTKEHLGVRLNAARAIIHQNTKTRRQINISRRNLDQLIISEAKKYEKKQAWLEQMDKTFSDELTASSLTFYQKSMRTILQKYLDQHMEFIFRCLSLYYHKSDLDVVYLNLKSTREKAKEDALEFLENLIHVRLKRIILPLIDRKRMTQPTTPVYDVTQWSQLLIDMFAHGNEEFVSAVLEFIKIKNDPEDIQVMRNYQFKYPAIELQKQEILRSVI